MFDPSHNLPKSRAASVAHIAALSTLVTDDAHKSLLDHLYGCLSILDAKASSLLTFNSVVIAVLAMFISNAQSLGEWIVIAPGMAAILISCLLLLSVVSIHWSTTEHLKDPDNHALTLVAIRTERTIKYRLAWMCAVGAVLDLGLFLVIEAL